MLALLSSLVDRIGGHFMSLRRYGGGVGFSHDELLNSRKNDLAFRTGNLWSFVLYLNDKAVSLSGLC